MHVQRVHGQVVRIHVEFAEDLSQREFASALLQHDSLGLGLGRGLDELQQVLLVHAGRRVDVSVHLRRGRTR